MGFFEVCDRLLNLLNKPIHLTQPQLPVAKVESFPDDGYYYQVHDGTGWSYARLPLVYRAWQHRRAIGGSEWQYYNGQSWEPLPYCLGMDLVEMHRQSSINAGLMLQAEKVGMGEFFENDGVLWGFLHDGVMPIAVKDYLIKHHGFRGNA